MSESPSRHFVLVGRRRGGGPIGARARCMGAPADDERRSQRGTGTNHDLKTVLTPVFGYKRLDPSAQTALPNYPGAGYLYPASGLSPREYSPKILEYSPNILFISQLQDNF